MEYKAAAHGFDEQFKIPLCCQKLRRITRLLSGNGKAKVGINVKSGSRSGSVLNLPIEHKIRQQKDFKIIMDFVVNTEPVCGLEIRTADLDPNGPSPLKISVLLIKGNKVIKFLCKLFLVVKNFYGNWSLTLPFLLIEN